MESAEYDIMYRVEDSHWWYRALRRIVFYQLDQFVPGWQSAAVLDAGCGTGATLAGLASRPRHVGLDLAPEALECCRRRELPNLVRGDVHRIPFADGSFAAVLSLSVLYHDWVSDVSHALAESHRVLEPGGFLLLVLPAFESLGSRHDERVRTSRRFTARDLRRLLHASGFQIRRLTYWNTLLFPLIWLVRRFGLVASGRDFDSDRAPPRWINGVLDLTMFAEFCALRCLELPFGVSLSAVAQKPAVPRDSDVAR